MKQLCIPVSKACPFVGASLYSLWVPCGFGGRAGSDVKQESCLVPVGADSCHFGRSWNCWRWSSSSQSQCEVRLLLCSVASTTLLGVGVSPKLVEQKPWGLSWVGSVPSKCVLSCLPAPQRGAVLEQDGWGQVLGVDLGVDCGGPSPSLSSGPLVMHCLTKCQCCLRPLQTLFQVSSASFPHSPGLLSAAAALALMRSYVTEQQGLEWALISGWGTYQGGHRKCTWVLCNFNLLCPPCL